jgi:hypothetical protein
MLHKKKNEKPEYVLQCSCVAWFKRNYPDYLIFSVPNESTHRQSTYYAKSGVLKGVSDLIIVLPEKVIFVELKSEKGYQRPEQKAFQYKVESLRQSYYLCRTLEDFKSIIKTQID